MGELFSVWTEVQRDFSAHIKEFQHQFDMILEGAKQLDLAKVELQTAEQKEGKLKKELKKAAKKATAEELREMSAKLGEAEREKDMAQLEVVDRVREHEAVKMIRIKEGLFKISEAYIDYAQKCDVIFGAQRDIALQIPDVQDRDIQDIKYTGEIPSFSTKYSMMDTSSRRWINSTVSGSGKRPDKEIPKAQRQQCIHPWQGTGLTLKIQTELCLQIISQDLPPPYSENPPMNPFYSERHDLSGPDLDHSGLDDSRPLVVSPPSQPAATHDPLYQHQQVCSCSE